MKKVVIGLSILAAVVVIAIAVVLHLTGGVVDAADEFFTTVGEGDVVKAYGLLSKEFQAATSLQELRAFLEGSQLTDYAKADWSTRSIVQDQGRLEGTVETSQGAVIPISVALVKEDGVWKILSIQKDKAGLVLEEDERRLPELDELENLTDESIQALASAINSRDFTTFHRDISRMWQTQITSDELYEIFRMFSEQDADLTVLQSLAPVFSQPPLIEDDGVMVLKGYYPSQPSVTYFDMQFVYEHPEWRLLGIGIRLE